jgi:Pilus formation protein N terminal region
MCYESMKEKLPMHTRRNFLCIAGATWLLSLRSSVQAQAGDGVEVAVGQTTTIQLPRLPMMIDSENHAVATLTVLPDGSARVTGVAVGTTRIVGQDFASVPILFVVNVMARVH